MVKCPICGKEIANPNAPSHVNSKYHQEALKVSISAPKSVDKKGVLKPIPKKEKVIPLVMKEEKEKITDKSLTKSPIKGESINVDLHPIEPATIKIQEPKPETKIITKKAKMDSKNRKKIVFRSPNIKLIRVRFQNIKEKIFKFQNFPESKTFFSGLLAVIFIFASIITGFMAILETEAGVYLKYFVIFAVIEVIFGCVLLADFLFRLWTCDHNPEYKHNKQKQLKYLTTFTGIIDLISAISFIILIITFSAPELIHLARVLRLVSFLKIIRYSPSFEIIWSVLKRKKEELLITMMLSLLLMFFASIFIYLAEHEAQPDKITNLFSSMWFTAINLFTIGYGDITPITPIGKLISVIVAILGITLFLLPASVIASGFIDEIEERFPKTEVCPNCGKTLQKDAFLLDLSSKKKGRQSKIVTQVTQVLEAEKFKEPKLSPSQEKQRKCYNLLQYTFPKTLGQVCTFFFFMFVITINVLSIMVETNPTLSQEQRPTLTGVYLFSLIVFVLDYLIRAWSCVQSEDKKYEDSLEGRLKYMRSGMAIVDLIVIAGLFLKLLIPNQLLILIPMIFIVFKVGHFIDIFFVVRIVFKNARKEFISSLLLGIIFVIFTSTAIYYAENKAQPDKFSSILSAAWFCMITFTTVGFGDVYPITTLGRFLTICFAFLGVALFTLPAGLLGASFFTGMKEYRLHRICPKCGFILSKPKIRNEE